MQGMPDSHSFAVSSVKIDNGCLSNQLCYALSWLLGGLEMNYPHLCCISCAVSSKG